MTTLHAGLAALALMAAAGCSNPLVDPDDLDTLALARSARDWSPVSIASELPVDSATRQVIEAGLRDLHGSLLALHQRLETQGAADGDEEMVLTPELEQELRLVHARHTALWNSLDAEVQATLAQRLHEHASHQGGDTATSLHERLRRLHGPDAKH